MDAVADGFGGRYLRGSHASSRVVTVRIDAVEFLKPVSVGADVSVLCALEHEGDTSIVVRIEVWAWVRTGDAPHKVTEGVSCYVAVSEDGRPTSSS